MLTPRQYYHSYLDWFIEFLIPPARRVFRFKTAGDRIISGEFDYIVIPDILGDVRDIQVFFQRLIIHLPRSGRLVVTQYSALWEPVLRLASRLGWRRPVAEQNWLSPQDLANFARLAGLEVVRSGSKMIFPIYLPIISSFLNRFVANLWPFSHLGLIHYVVLRPDLEPSRPTAPSLSVIVPARNERGTIEKIVRELPELGAFTEIVFIEGNSTDHTWSEIERVAKNKFGKKRLLAARQEGKGKGDAVRKGFDLATGDIVTIYDADMTVPPTDLVKFYQALVRNRGDFINGSRLVYPLERESMRVINFLGNKFFSLAFSWILGQPIKDTLCGTKMFWRTDYKQIQTGRSFFGDFDPFGDFDLLFGAAKLNLKIVDLPIRYRERVYGTTNISRWRHGWLLLKMTIFAARKIKFV